MKRRGTISKQANKAIREANDAIRAQGEQQLRERRLRQFEPGLVVLEDRAVYLKSNGHVYHLRPGARIIDKAVVAEVHAKVRAIEELRKQRAQQAQAAKPGGAPPVIGDGSTPAAPSLIITPQQFIEGEMRRGAP